ncbi:hypothetical protein GC425_04675 [Corynebacterium sp. zg254]|uniref:DUF2795 domain-containing protein n=1 Tax=Corynebacterium zhongnanshanii TaxID=2768834 RepID=A0ABQ6VER5_9CORY|nr:MULTISPECIES: hypothetical protein [Corynebacterium]KAB3522770.1 hypothetical protein F8377_00940 [Corynebacterium zhongnanshanii]MCR5914167.1 hypothetical protein [Corynebacterium sp. zg254]
METDYEVYEWLDRVLPPHVYREMAQQAYDAGEPDSAVADLLEEAVEAGALPPEILQRLKLEYPEDPVVSPIIEICERKLESGELP